MKWILAVLCVTSLVACESKQPPPSPAQADSGADMAKAAPNAVEVPEQLPWTGPAERLALPHKILAMRMKKASAVGTLKFEDGNPTDLNAFGLNLCQTGWVFQGFSRPDGSYKSTPNFMVPVAEIPLGRKFEYRSPTIKDSYIEFDMTAWSMNRVKGTIRLMDSHEAGKELLVMQVDGEPITIAAAPGFGAQGCFTTGYYRANEKSQGPVTAVWDGGNLFYASMRLDERRAIAVEFALRAHQRKPTNILQLRLARVFEEPKKFPIRAYFEIRKDRQLADGETGPTQEVERIPVTSGNLRAVFLSQNPAGPVRADITGLELPEAFGAWEGEKTLDLRMEALFVTDLKGQRVPVPGPPKWELSAEAVAGSAGAAKDAAAPAP